ncbi:uncharacterized protein LOC126905247 isoform X2 [Daktulosphaira vitifoliae]|uniref:uncharacterized protein LOC126905247 isoform X2 n=1 Tax=Daktulosphaira vitifoliae TaxID=58002 RepID=UPI0021A9D04A|nr:uncharacterized protein LOC126905247 isoform X2 [Daktulosphaira vitifoliae]
MAKIFTCVQIDMDNITVDVAIAHIIKHKTLLRYQMQTGSVYTSDKVNVKSFNKFYLNYDIHIPVPLDKPYQGTAPHLSYRTPVDGRTLEEVTKSAIQEYEDPMEAILWLRNVIESIGITTLVHYCLFTAQAIKIMPKEANDFRHHFNEASKFFNFLSEIFNYYRLRREPINEIILIYNEYNQSPKLVENKQKFSNQRTNYFNRFEYCMFLVKMPQKKIFTHVINNLNELNKTKLETLNFNLVNFYNQQLILFYSYIQYNANILKGWVI